MIENNISIVVPLYNKESHILRALNSIYSQDYSNYEVLIINDGSTDSSEKRVTEWINSRFDHRFNIYSQVNRGVSSARNLGYKIAKYEFVAFLDADDYWFRNTHLCNINKSINSYGSQVEIYANSSIIFKNNKYINLHKKIIFKDGVYDYFYASLISQLFVTSSSVCLKKNKIIKIPFPEGINNNEDIIVWAKFSNFKGFAFSSEPTVIIDNSQAELSKSFSGKSYEYFINEINKIEINYFTKKYFIYKHLLMNFLYLKTQVKKCILTEEILNTLNTKLSTFFIILYLINLFASKKFLLILQKYKNR